MDKLAIYQELEKRGELGKLSPEKQAVYAELKNRGVVPSAPSVDYSGTEEAIRAGVQGASLGLGDEISGLGAGIGAGIAALQTGQPILETAQRGYEQEAANRRAKQEAFGQDYPKTKLASEIAGGVAMPYSGAMGQFIGRGATTTGRALRSAGVGAGVGAGFGLGSEGDIGERIGAGITGAALGGATGGIASPVLEKAITSLTPSGLNKTDKFIRENIPVNKAGEFFDKLSAGVKEGRNMQLPDIAGADLQQAIRKMRTTGAKDIIDSALETRSKAENARLSRLLENEFGANKFLQNIDDIEIKYGRQAQPLYESSYEFPSFKSEVIDELMQTPAMQSAMKTAEKKAINERIPLQTGEGYNTRQIDYIKRALDDKINIAIRAGKKDESRILTGIKNEMLEEIDAINPIYKEARDVAGEKIRIVKSQEQGLKFDSMTPEAIKRYVKSLKPPEREGFLLGAKEKLVKKITSTSETGSSANKIFGNDWKKLQIKELFDNPEEYQSFAQSLQDEILAGKANFRMTGGSQTAENQSPEMRKFLANLLYNPRTTAADALFKGVSKIKGVNPQTVATQMFEPTQAGNIDSLRRISQYEANLGNPSFITRNLQKQIPITAGLLAGRK